MSDSEGRTFTLPPFTADQKAYLADLAERLKPLTDKQKRNFLIPGPNFDADLSPQNPRNQDAALVRQWTYDYLNEKYRDKNREFVADKFGQPF
jgi:hypothetical protein